MCDENGLTLEESSKVVRKSKATSGSKHKVSIDYFTLYELSDVIYWLTFTFANIYELHEGLQKCTYS
jgi:hypothetical protein